MLIIGSGNNNYQASQGEAITPIVANKSLIEELQSLLDTKVDKVPGYWLSENDFTNELKEKLESMGPGKPGGGSGGGSLITIDSLAELEEREDLRNPGQQVYVKDVDTIYYYSTSERWKFPSEVVISNEEPKNKALIWVDGSEKSLPSYTNEDLRSINIAINEIQQNLNKINFAFEGALVPGDFTNSARIKMITQATPIKPEGAPDRNPVSVDTTPDPELEGQYPEWAESWVPNIKHLTVKIGKYSDMLAHKKDFIMGELLYCYDRNSLYIINHKGQFKLINGGGGSSGEGSGGLDLTAIDSLETIGFVTPNGGRYRVKVTDAGKLTVYKRELDFPQAEPSGGSTDDSGWVYVTTLYLQQLYINAVYCGGLTADEKSYNLCSHNFVELSNLTPRDISLNGLSLQYCTEGTNWSVLPLWGEIKAGSTFLIRGAQCSVMDVNTTRIKVREYDMEWYEEENQLIKFDNNKAKFFLTWGTTPSTVASPYKKVGTEYRVSKGYIDLVGFNKEKAGSADIIDAYEGTAAYSYLNSDRIFTKYYAMDPVKQATKALDKRANAKDWYYVDLTKDVIPSVEAYTPRASYENKNLFYNKTHFDNTKPNMINVTFGIQATAPNATRCFNWVSCGYYDEFLWFRKKPTDSWTKVESFKNESGVRKYYNRIRTIATDGTAITVHKVIVKNLEEGEYEYKIGRATNGEPNNYISDIKTFTIRTAAVVNGSFKFVHTSDQQGFNWDEYIVWKKSAEYIKNNVPDIEFTINTGDIAQNGNRVNEWLDYYNGRVALDGIEDMTTIGNNDLCPSDPTTLGTGNDDAKINSDNITYYYTYEIDENNPPVFNIEGKEIYIASLYSFNYGNCHFICVNSEIPPLTETECYGLSVGGQVYDKIKEWCEKDVKNNSSYSWRIAYCHEMPFTIITQNVINNYYWEGVEYPANERSGSRLNFNTSDANKYWFSRFCQDNDIRLVLGGHKHTYSCSWPIKENVTPEGEVLSMKPIIQVTVKDLQDKFNCNALYTETDGLLKGYSFPESWKTNQQMDMQKHLCTFELVEKPTAPVYSMLQATGYKHTSNKELPSPNIPWLKEFFPATITIKDQKNVTAKVNSGQRYPFYTVWEVTPTKITGTAKKIDYIFTTSGTFNINIPSSTNQPAAIGGNGQTNNGNDLIVINK